MMSSHNILMVVTVVTLLFVAIIVFFQTASVFVLHLYMEQAIFDKLMTGYPTSDAP